MANLETMAVEAAGLQQGMANPPITLCLLPIDAIKNIFSRLPFRTVLSLRLVNKFCYKVTSSPDFIKVYIKLCRDDATLPCYKVFVNDHNSVSQFYVDSSLLPCLRNNMGLGSVLDWVCGKVVGSCNEFICSVEPDCRFRLWNPVTGKRLCLSRLIVEDRCVNKSFGFGYDAVNDDYKVLAVLLYSRPVDLDDGHVGYMHPTTVQVCSVKRNSWRSIDVKVFNDGAVLGGNSSTVVNGKIHWFLNKFQTNGIKNGIITFDIEKEVFGMIEQPTNGRWDSSITLGALRGCLSVISKDPDKRVDLWVMKEYGVKDSWTKIVIVGADQGFERIRPCCILPNGKILLATNDSFVIYNEKNKFLELAYPPNPKLLDSAPYYFEDQGGICYVHTRFDFSSCSRTGENRQKQKK